jgi:two-component system chemotaxis response regulator CheY
MAVPSILFAGSNYLLMQSIKDVLEMAGWHIETSDDGCMARAMIEERKVYDLLILDNEIRGINGIELTRRARQVPHLKETPIILISVQDCEEEARQAGADAFLRKPNNIIELLDVVRRLLGQG